MSTLPKKTTRARITARDAEYLAFLAKFPGADKEALSFLKVRQANNLGQPEGELASPASVEKRFQKLKMLGAVNDFRNPITGVKHYGITPLGNEAVSFYGHNVPVWRGIEKLSISRLDHYRNIALVAAQLNSEAALFKNTLHLDPVPLDQLISENEMSRAYTDILALIKDAKENGKATTDFPTMRDATLHRALDQIKEGTIAPDEILTIYPQLFTFGNSDTRGNLLKPIHQIDLAVRLDDNNRNHENLKPRNLGIEVELSTKTPAEYQQILRTMKAELKRGAVYERFIYFTNNPGISRTIKRADEQAKTNLIDTGKLLLLGIKGRDGKNIPRKNRVPRPDTTPEAVVPGTEHDDELPPLN